VSGGGGDLRPAFDADRHIDALAPTLGLTITAEQRPGVARFLAVAHLMASALAGAPIEESTLDLAPVFTPGARGAGTS
jgi:hypothetical protein